MENNSEILVILLSEYLSSFIRRCENNYPVLENNKSTHGEIPVRILQESQFSSEILKNCINKSIEDCSFPDSLKEANIKPIFKKDDSLVTSSDRPVSILSLPSKVYERLFYNQLLDYTEVFLRHKRFQKAHSTQHALLNLLQS